MNASKRHNADLLVVLLLFMVYAGCALLLCALGASFYSNTVAVSQEGFNQRTGLLYMVQRVHQNDIGGGMRLDTYQGSDALVLIEQETGQGFETWIFIQDGFLCEQLIAQGTSIIPDQVQRVMPMQSLSLSLTDRLLSVSLTTDTGTVNAINLYVRSSGDTFNAGASPPASASTASEDAAMSGPTIMNPAFNDPATEEEGEH